MSNLQIEVNEDILQSEEGITWLIEAANDIFTASETDFNLMKTKKWYNRLWEVVTLSKDNEKVLAKGTANLAKLQEIVMKALVILSDKSGEIASYIKENSDCIERLSRNQIILLNEIQNIKYGVEKNISLDDLDYNKKYIILNVLSKYAEENPGNELSKEYIAAIFRSQKFSYINIKEVDCEIIEELKQKEIVLLYHLLMEYSYIAYDDFNTDSTIFDYIGISKKKIDEIENRINSLSNIAGKRFFIDIYDNSDNEDIYYLEDNEDIYYDKYVDDTSRDSDFKECNYENGGENKGIERSVIKDDTPELYPEIKELVTSYIPKIYDGLHKKQSSKKYENFIKASKIIVNIDTIICLLDMTLRGSGTSGILFTTAAFYYYGGSLSKDLILCRYNDIKDVTIQYVNKRTTTINIFMVNGEQKIITNPLWIKSDKFMELIIKIIEISKEGLIPNYDYIIKLKALNADAMVSYFKILIDMLEPSEDCSFELYILLHNYEINEYCRREIFKYYNDRNSDIYRSLVEFDNKVDYPSKTYWRKTLISDFIKIIYNQGKDHIGVKEQKILNTLAKYYDISNKTLQENILTSDNVYILKNEYQKVDEIVDMYTKVYKEVYEGAFKKQINKVDVECNIEYTMSFDNDEVKVICIFNESRFEHNIPELSSIYKLLCGIRKDILDDYEYLNKYEWFINLEDKVNYMYNEFKIKLLNKVHSW